MKKLILIAVASVTSGCSPLMYSGPYGPVPPLHYGYGQRTPHVEATPVGRWDNVMRLPRASTIDVLTNDGAASIGLIAGADAQSVRLMMETVEVRIARANIVRIDLVDLAGPDTAAVARKAARGALAGAGVVGVITGVVGGELWPPPARAVRAGVAIGAVGAGQAEAIRRSPRMIYLAPDQSGRRSTRPGDVPVVRPSADVRDGHILCAARPSSGVPGTSKYLQYLEDPWPGGGEKSATPKRTKRMRKADIRRTTARSSGWSTSPGSTKGTPTKRPMP